MIYIYRMKKILEFIEEEIWWGIQFRYRNITSSIKNFFFPRQRWIKKYVKWNGWCDKDYLMVDFIRGCIIEYVDGEKCFEEINWAECEETIQFKKELIECYRWFKYGTILAEKELERHWEKVPKDPMTVDVDGLCHFKYGSEIYNDVHKTEEYTIEQNTKYMLWAVKNRMILWT